MNDFTISRAFPVWLCRSLESSSLLLHFSGFWQYLFLQDGWYCASQANRSTPLILVSRCSSCFSCAILWNHPTIICKPNGSFCRPTTLHFNVLSPFLFTKYSLVWILFCQDQETYGVYFQNHYCLQWMVAVLASDSGSLWTYFSNPCDNPIPQKK